jgi:nucleoside permease NupC
MRVNILSNSKNRIDQTEYPYNIKPQFKMISQKKLDIALGLAIAVIVAALILAWVALRPYASEQQKVSDSVKTKTSQVH